jgi:uncharacterized protein (TIGR03435 family)
MLPSFEVASIKLSDIHRGGAVGIFTFPGGKVTAGFCTFKMLVMYAFNVQPYQVSGGPRWTNDDRYDVIAIPPSSSHASKLNPPYLKVPPNEEQRRMLQSLLIDRFHLNFHRASRVGPVYILGKSNRKLRLEDAKNKNDHPWAGSLAGGGINGDGLAGRNISMAELATRLSGYLDRPVLDRTGLNGSYDFKYEYSADPADAAYHDVLPCIFASVKGIGLDLKATKGQVETIVVDHVERPTEN